MCRNHSGSFTAYTFRRTDLSGKNRMKILFVICGEGLGHASRSSKLSRYLTEHGHTCHLASYGRALTFLRDEGIQNLHETVREVILEGEGGYFSFTKTLRSSSHVIMDLYRAFADVRQLIQNLDVDLVIADTMYAAVPAARIEKIPALFMTNQNRFASAAAGEDAIQWRALSTIVDHYLTIPDAIIVPDFAPPWTICGENIIPTPDHGEYHFVGPMMDENIGNFEIRQETVFASFGGEPFKIPLYKKLKEIGKNRPDLPFEVFSTAQGLPKNGYNFETFGYVPDIREHMAKARVMILHGGLTTLHDAMFFRKPSVIIIDPYHPEQWNNARKVAAMGAGIIVKGSQDLSIPELSEAIDRAMLLTPPDLSEQFRTQNGRENALRLIEETLEKYPH